MMNCGVYLIHNVESAKFYVGSSINIKGRWSAHISKLNSDKHGNRHLQNSWKKYGEQAFRFYIIGNCSTDEILKLEQKYIDQIKPEYNLSPTAGNCLGVKHSDATRKKMTGRKLSVETRSKMSNAKKGIIFSDEHRLKIAKANKEKAQCSEFRKKMSETHKGKWHSEETRQLMCETRKGRKHSLETRRKMSEAHKGNSNMLGKTHSNETRQRMSEAQRLRWSRVNTGS